MHVRTPVDLGLVIRDRRRALGWDQRTLAEHASVSRQWIVAVERGKAGAEVGLLLRVLNVLGLRVEVAAEAAAGSAALVVGGAKGAAVSVDLDAIIDRARGRRR